MSEEERLKQEEDRRFDPDVPPAVYARAHHFAVNQEDSPEVFDLDTEGIALPGHVIRWLGEYAQGNGEAKKLYVDATDLKLVSNRDVYQAAQELERQNEKLNSSELDKLVSELRSIALGRAEEDDEEFVHLRLSEEELRALAYIAARYDSARIILDAYEPETGTIAVSEVIDAFLATREDGGDLGTVPLAGGTLEKKIGQLWDEAGAMEYVQELLDE